MNKKEMNKKAGLSSFKEFFLLIFFFVFFSISIINADIISKNPAGSLEHAMSPEKYIEGFFFSSLGESWIGISNCTNLTIENSTYKLTSNASSYSTCFYIQANNVTLDCNGFWINYSTGGVLGYGINNTGYNYTTIKNCVVNEGGGSTTSSKHGIYFFRGNNGLLKNNIFNNSGGSSTGGIYLRESSLNNISNNSFFVYGSYSGRGVILYLGGNNTVELNQMDVRTRERAAGISIESSSTNSFVGNAINSSGGTNSYLVTGSSLNHYNQSVDSSNLAEGKPVNYTFNIDNLIYDGIDFTPYGQVIFAWSRNITISNSNFSEDSLNLFYTNTSLIEKNFINTSKGYGIHLLYNSNGTSIKNNTILTSGGWGNGIYVYTACYFNNISYNNVTSSGGSAAALNLGSSYSALVENNTFNASSYYAVMVRSANWNNISNNILQGYRGVNFWHATNNKFINNSIVATILGIYFSGADANETIINNTISSGGSYAIQISGAYNRTGLIFTNTLLNSSTAEFYLASDVLDGEYNFTNITRADGSPIRVSWTSPANGTMNVHWYLDVNVMNSTDMLPGANVSSWNVNGNFAFSELTSGSGSITRKTLLEYSRNRTTTTYFSPYTVNTSLVDYITDSDSVNLSLTNNTNLTVILRKSNTAPNIPTLISPPNENVTTNRTPTFYWNGSDPDGDSLTYELNLTCYNGLGGGCSDDDRLISGISAENYTLTEYLEYLKDKGYYYNWTVRAYDGLLYSDWASPWKLEIQAELGIVLINDSINFGSLGMEESKNTTINSPYPFSLENNGTCFVNVSMNATPLWNTVVSESDNYKFKVDNLTGEEGSFNWLQSLTSWAQMPITGQSVALVAFNFSDSTDSAEIDVLVTVPNQEPSGNRQSTVYFSASLGE